MSTKTSRKPFGPARATAPRNARWLLLAACALSAGAAVAALPLQTIEECIETGTESVRLPGTANGALSASACSGCPAIRLQFDPRTRYFVGTELVNYAKFLEASAKADLRLDVYYEPKSRTLTRLRIPAVASAK